MGESTYELLLDIMNPDIESDREYVREIIHLAEDTDFSIEESKIVSPWLLNFALENRDGDDLDDAIYSAIRTGASMLYPSEVECLFPLLEKGHKIDTSLVAIKMIGRMFEAQPPSKMGEYENIAEKIYDFLNPMLDRHLVVSPGRDGAIAELCTTSLVAMGSKKIYPILEKVKDKEKWFRQYLLHNMKDLKVAWQSRTVPVDSSVAKFLNKVIEILEEMVSDTV